MKKLAIIGLALLPGCIFGVQKFDSCTLLSNCSEVLSNSIVGSPQYSVPYYSSSGNASTLTGLNPGTIGQILTSSGAAGAPYWSVPAAGGNFINNQSTLQSGATFYVSSGTVAGQLTAKSINVGTNQTTPLIVGYGKDYASQNWLRFYDQNGIEKLDFTGFYIEPFDGVIIKSTDGQTTANYGYGNEFTTYGVILTSPSYMAWSDSDSNSGTFSIQVRPDKSNNKRLNIFTGTYDGILHDYQSGSLGADAVYSNSVITSTVTASSGTVAGQFNTLSTGITNRFTTNSSGSPLTGNVFKNTTDNQGTAVIIQSSATTTTGGVVTALSAQSSAYPPAPGGFALTTKGGSFSASGGTTNIGLEVTAGSTTITAPEGMRVTYGVSVGSMTASSATISGQLIAGTIISPSYIDVGDPTVTNALSDMYPGEIDVYAAGGNQSVYILPTNISVSDAGTLNSAAMTSYDLEFGGISGVLTIGHSGIIHGSPADTSIAMNGGTVYIGTGTYSSSKGSLVSGAVTTSTMTLSGIYFSTLSLWSPPNGAMQYCIDCTVTTPATCTANLLSSCVCAGSGSGAFAKRLNGSWLCN